MRVSDAFFRRTGRKYLYNITPIANSPSIVRYGILCYDEAKNRHHTSIAMDEVQKRRDQLVIPGGLRLHEYANLYFTYHNPMLYKRKDQADALCILALSAEVLNIDECVLSDRNAAASLTKFYSAYDGVCALDFEMIFAQYWTHEDDFEQYNHKAIKCAEVLVPTAIPFGYVIGAYVVGEEARQMLLEAGFDRKILVRPQVFYR